MGEGFSKLKSQKFGNSKLHEKGQKLTEPKLVSDEPEILHTTD